MADHLARLHGARSTAALGIVALVAAAGCDMGSEEPAVPRASAPTVSADAEEIAVAFRPAILQALARDAACGAEACSTPAGLRRRADAIAAAVAPLDDALARHGRVDAKRPRAATSAFLHAVEEMKTCFELSADEHAGVAALADCRRPVSQFERAVVDLRASVGASRS